MSVPYLTSPPVAVWLCIVTALTPLLSLPQMPPLGIKAVQAFMKQAVALVTGPLTWPLALVSYILEVAPLFHYPSLCTHLGVHAMWYRGWPEPMRKISSLTPPLQPPGPPRSPPFRWVCVRGGSKGSGVDQSTHTQGRTVWPTVTPKKTPQNGAENTGGPVFRAPCPPPITPLPLPPSGWRGLGPLPPLGPLVHPCGYLTTRRGI